MDIPKLELLPVDVPTIEDIVADTFKPSTLFTAVVHLVLWTPIITVIALLTYCCYPRLKKRCCNRNRELTAFEHEKGTNAFVKYTVNPSKDTEPDRADYSARISSLRDYVASVFTRPVSSPPNPNRRGSRDSTDSWIERVQTRLQDESPPPRIHRV